jgi:AcrR family transcriptional regulator
MVGVVKGRVSRQSRRERGRATRRRIVEAADQLIRERGYAGTTVADVAEAAGVAVQTVYFTFGTKSALVLAAFDRATLGGQDIPPQQQAWYLRARDEPDLAKSIQILVAQLRGVTATMMPVYRALLAATATDRDVAVALAERERYWIADSGVVVGWLADKRALRPGMDAVRGADIFRMLLGPASYAALVIDSGWTEDAWATWVARSLEEELFERAE